MRRSAMVCSGETFDLFTDRLNPLLGLGGE